MERDGFNKIYYPRNVLALISDNADEKMIDHVKKTNAECLDSTALTYMGLHISYNKMFERIKEYALELKA